MPKSIYREWIEALKNVDWGSIRNVQLNSGQWHWFVLVRFKRRNRDDRTIYEPQDVLVKVVGVVENNNIDYDKLVQPDLSQAPGRNSSNFVFDPFGAAILKRYRDNQENVSEYRSVLLEKLGFLSRDQKFVQTYSWKIDEKRWNLVGSLPLVPPMEVGGICWDGKYLEDFRLSAVRFPDLADLTKVLAVTMRLGVVVGLFDRLEQDGGGMRGQIVVNRDARGNNELKSIKIRIGYDQDNGNLVHVRIELEPGRGNPIQILNQDANNSLLPDVPLLKLYYFTTP